MKDNTVLLTAYAAVPNEVAAMVVADSTARILAPYGRIRRSDTKRYWKIPEYFEVFFEVEPSEEIGRCFLRILDALGAGWEVHRFDDGNDWAVWNASSKSSFVLPEVRWAHLECLRM